MMRQLIGTLIQFPIAQGFFDVTFVVKNEGNGIGCFEGL